MSINIQKDLIWTRYYAKSSNLEKEKVGKWLYFFSDYNLVEELCKKAVEGGIVTSAKHRNDEKGVACFYLNIDDSVGHKRVINFFIENDMIQRTNSGRLYNISFKLDEQTRAGEYGDDYKPELKLGELMNLETTEWLV